MTKRGWRVFWMSIDASWWQLKQYKSCECKHTVWFQYGDQLKRRHKEKTCFSKNTFVCKLTEKSKADKWTNLAGQLRVSKTEIRSANYLEEIKG